MDFERIKAWLERKTAREMQTRLWCGILGIVLIPLGLVVGIVMLFFLAVWAMRGSGDETSAGTCLWIALGVEAILFVAYQFFPKADKKEVFYHDEPDTSLTGTYIRRQKMKAGVLLWFIFTAPRLLAWVIFSFRRIAQLKRQDTHSCGAVLWLLLLKGKRLTHADIQAELDWVDVEGTLAQLSWLPGLRFINTGVAMVSVMDDLRGEIRRDLVGDHPVLA